MRKPLSVYAGEQAFAHIKQHGLTSDDIAMVLGASSGPKWLVLHGIDQFLFQHFFQNSRRAQPLHLLGTSAGAWRMACYAQENALAAHRRLTDAYVDQPSMKKPKAEEVLSRCEDLVRSLLGETGAHEIIHHNYARMHLITTQCHGLTTANSKLTQGVGYGLAGLMNGVSRKWLGAQFTRVVMHHPQERPPMHPVSDLPTRHEMLSTSSLERAMVSTGAIPILIKGVEDVAGKGIYQDGGITDYGFDLPLKPEQGFVLYPHFTKIPSPGWFDKKLRWRAPSTSNYDRTILLVPSDEFIAGLPYGKIPDRKDFFNLPEKERISYWRKTIEMSLALFDDLMTMDWADRVEPLPWAK
jgi:hypothetical protein